MKVWLIVSLCVLWALSAGAQELQEMQQKIEKMLDESDELERSGHYQEANKLRDKARALYYKLKELREQQETQELMNDARELEADEMRKETEARKKEQPHRQARPFGKEKIQDMLRQAQQLESKGYRDEAMRLRRRAEILQKQLYGRQQLQKILKQVQNLKQAGRHEEAKKMYLQAQELQRRLVGHSHRPHAAGYEKLHAFWKKVDPERVEHLKRLQRENPHAFRREMHRLLEETRDLQRLQKENPEVFKNLVQMKQLDYKSRELAERYRKTSDEAAKEKLKKELQGMIKQIFKFKIENKKREIAEITEDLQKMKLELETHIENEQRIIDRRVREMLAEDEFDW